MSGVWRGGGGGYVNVHEKSPFYIGTKLWNELSVETQSSTDIFEFKKHIARLNCRYKKL